MNQPSLLESLDAAKSFLDAHADLPAPSCIELSNSAFRPVSIEWHVGLDHTTALDILRGFADWSWTAINIDARTTTYALEVEGVRLTIYAASAVATPVTVNLLDALAEVSA